MISKNKKEGKLYDQKTKRRARRDENFIIKVTYVSPFCTTAPLLQLGAVEQTGQHEFSIKGKKIKIKSNLSKYIEGSRGVCSLGYIQLFTIICIYKLTFSCYLQVTIL